MTGSGRTTARAASWAFLSTIGAKVVTLASLALLARLLSPAEFGLLAFALTYIVYVETIGDLGSGVALIYWPDRRDDAAQVTFIVNVIAGVFWCLLTIALAPWIADFFNAPGGIPLVQALAFGFVIKYLGTTHDALAQKDLRFRERTVPELAMALVKAGVAVTLAWRGFGAWSLVWGHLTGMVAWTSLLWAIVPWRPRRSLPRDLFRPMLSYGRGIIFVNVLTAIEDRTDLAVVGRYLGLRALGLYQLASKLPEATIAVIVRVASRVLVPAFSGLHARRENLQAAYLLASRYIGAMTLPIVTGLAILAQPIILTFFGRQWIEAAPMVSALAILGGVRAISNHAGDVLKATGRATLLARFEAVRAAMIVPAVLIAAQRSAVSVAMAMVAVDGIATLIVFRLTSRAIGIGLGAIARAFAPSVLSAAVMAAALAAWQRWSPAWGTVPTLMVSVALGAVVYLTALHVTDPTLLAGARSLLFPRREEARDD
ncbi:MAG: lipopolysaccharide biosynthesis protein [Thermoanaerobaculia bacterium]